MKKPALADIENTGTGVADKKRFLGVFSYFYNPKWFFNPKAHLRRTCLRGRTVPIVVFYSFPVFCVTSYGNFAFVLFCSVLFCSVLLSVPIIKFSYE
jgi:hypothetical protein